MQPFDNFNLRSELITAISELGYETPSPIQEKGIPVLMDGKDIIAQAQTGTGKTATFALPILSKIDPKSLKTQALIIAPTRELAIQVAEACKSYAKHIKGFHVLPIYGGQDYKGQLKALKRGVQVVVGTPGRTMDHMRNGKLPLDHLKMLVLDEADEMLNMGFIEDIEWILENTPDSRQTALFSATMPAPIKKIATKYTNNAESVHIAPEVKTVESIDQYYMLVNNHHKVEALTRFLETQDVEAAIIFTRTKNGSNEVAQKLEARGYSAAPLNGDMNQAAREKILRDLKKKTLDIVVATDVAARGIDEKRINLVVNYDIPHDPESYVHRIGRTGRAGRTGKSMMLVTPREMGMLKVIERRIKKAIEAIEPPSAKQVMRQRVASFNENVLNAAQENDLEEYRKQITNILEQSDVSTLDIAAALASLLQKKTPLTIDDQKDLRVQQSSRRAPQRDNKRRSSFSDSKKPRRKPNSKFGNKTFAKKSSDDKPFDKKKVDNKASTKKATGKSPSKKRATGKTFAKKQPAKL